FWFSDRKYVSPLRLKAELNQRSDRHVIFNHKQACTAEHCALILTRRYGSRRRCRPLKFKTCAALTGNRRLHKPKLTTVLKSQRTRKREAYPCTTRTSRPRRREEFISGLTIDSWTFVLDTKEQARIRSLNGKSDTRLERRKVDGIQQQVR